MTSKELFQNLQEQTGTGLSTNATMEKLSAIFFFYLFIYFLSLITFIQSTINNQKYLQTLRYLHYLQYNI